jgi:hypothetical protein
VWARDMSVNGSVISRFDLAGTWLPFATHIFVYMEKIALACFGKQLFSH